MECTGRKICKGIFCQKFKKSVQCCRCKVWLCKCCDLKVGRKTYCIDCLVKVAINKVNESIFPSDILGEPNNSSDCTHIGK